MENNPPIESVQYEYKTLPKELNSSLYEIQSSLMSFLNANKNSRMEVHLHFIVQTNTNGINIYGNYNSIESGGLK